MKRRRNAKRPSPVQAWYQATRKQGEADELFMQFVREGMTREELAALIERRPALWGRYSGFLSKLPSGKKNPRRYRRNSRMSRLAKQARKRVAIKRTLRRAGHAIPAGLMFKTGALRQYRRRKLGYNARDLVAYRRGRAVGHLSPPTTQWWLVAPRFCERIASPEAGLKRAHELERWARKTHGSQAGADCWVVAQRGDTLECGAGSGGHCVEDSFVQVGCAAAVERVRKEIWSACAVAHSI